MQNVVSIDVIAPGIVCEFPVMPDKVQSKYDAWVKSRDASLNLVDASVGNTVVLALEKDRTYYLIDNTKMLECCTQDDIPDLELSKIHHLGNKDFYEKVYSHQYKSWEQFIGVEPEPEVEAKEEPVIVSEPETEQVSEPIHVCAQCGKEVTQELLDANIAIDFEDNYFCSFECYTKYVFSGE